MTTYNVHLYREMRLYFPGIEADSHDAAAEIVSRKPTSDADNVEDCDGQNLAALVDVVGDEDYGQSMTIDFEPERQRQAAPKLLAALKYALEFLEANDDGEEDVTARIASAQAAIAQAEATDIVPEPTAPRLLGVLQAVLPYAEAERASLCEAWRRDRDQAVNVELHACDLALDDAVAAIAEATAAGIIPAPATAIGKHPSRFEIEHDPKENPDRVYVLVDGKFDVAIIRTDEGIVVDVYHRNGLETIATTYAFDADAEAEESGEA